MTISASPLTIEHIPGVAKSASAWFHTTDPGVFAVDYPDGITGPATVEAAGTRAYRSVVNGRDAGFNAPAALAAILKDRNNRTLFFDIPYDQFPKRDPQNSTSLSNGIFTVYAAYRRLSWRLTFLVTASTAIPYIVASLNSGSNAGIVLTGTAFSIATTGSYRCAITSAAGTPNVLSLHSSASAKVTANPATWADGFGTSIALFNSGFSFAAHTSVISDGDIATWTAGGALPAGAVVDYRLLEETGTAYDFSENAYDGVYNLDATYPASQIVRVSTDTGFSSPLVEVPIVIAADCTAGLKNITLRRTRVGIPVRTPALPDAVVYDDGILPITVTNPTTVLESGPNQYVRSRLP